MVNPLGAGWDFEDVLENIGGRDLIAVEVAVDDLKHFFFAVLVLAEDDGARQVAEHIFPGIGHAAGFLFLASCLPPILIEHEAFTLALIVRGLAVGATCAFSLVIAGQVLLGSCPNVSATLTTMAFDHSRSRWFGIGYLIAEPEGPSFISSTVARSRVDRLRS
jgi:hypothetical protein